MLRFLKALLLWLAVAGLPLQAHAAATMAWCGHGNAGAPATARDSHAMHADFHHPGDRAPAADSSCGDCSQCHLCSAHALPGLAMAAPAQPATIHVARPVPPSGGFVPDLPKRPPLA